VDFVLVLGFGRADCNVIADSRQQLNAYSSGFSRKAQDVQAAGGQKAQLEEVVFGV
jgi:hypothetical protein